MSLSMFPLSIATDETGFEILIKILSYLNPDEVKKARLVNLAFNQIILSEPQLLWANNVLRVPVLSESAQEWNEFSSSSLVLSCPNFHFVRTNLCWPATVDFFRNLGRRPQIKHLKLTECFSKKHLLSILSHCSECLEHLEIVGFSRIQISSSDQTFPLAYKRSAPALTSLSALVLENGHKSEQCETQTELSHRFLKELLSGTNVIEMITVRNWHSKTFVNAVRTLRWMTSEVLENLHTLEMNCILSHNNFDAKKQYAFLKELERIRLPSLRNLTITFDCPLPPNNDNKEVSVVEVCCTNGIATLIESAQGTLEVLELINCPVTSQIFKNGIKSFPHLYKINTNGSFSINMDENLNPIYELFLRNELPKRRKVHNRKTSLRPAHSVSTSSSNSTDSQSQSQLQIQRTEVYKRVCSLLIFVVITHFVVDYMVGNLTYIGTNLEILIYTVFALYFLKGNEIMDVWHSNFDIPEMSTNDRYYYND